MKRNLLNALVLAALATPGLALAADAAPASPHTFTSNVGLVSDYLYRGISQTNASAALQGGFDYAHSSGLYAGLWGSNVSWITGSGAAGNASLELDTYAGFKGGLTGDVTYDVGYLRYNYPGTYTPTSPAVKADTDEIYGALGWKWLTAKYSYSLGDTFAVANAKGSSYLDLSAAYSLPDTGINLGAHYGKQTFKGTGNDIYTYSDYKLSASKDFSGYVLGLAYSNTNAIAASYTYAGKNWARSTTVASVTRSF